MTSSVERRYRRVLRLLPATYRDSWEEDMVTAYMDGSATAGRRTFGERLSVVTLAVRLRLNGSHASSRGLVWYRTVHALALLVLLYQAVSATVWFVTTVGIDTTVFHIGLFDMGFLANSMALSGLPWIPAFACFLAGRFVAARVFALLAAGSAIAFMVLVAVIEGPSREPVSPSDVGRWVWLVVSVLAAFVTPAGARASRWPWATAYLVGSAAGSVVLWHNFSPVVAGFLTRIYPLRLIDVACVGLAIAMVAALAKVWWSRSPHWLLALAATAGAVAGVRVLRSFTTITPPTGGVPYEWQMYVVNITLVVLAIVGTAVGLFRWYGIAARTRT